ncbi:MAG: hypothetical protein U0031_04260 [Thermomicrobiales bacterium]
MTRSIGPSHRVAAALAGIFLLLTIAFGFRHWQTTSGIGWNLGNNDRVTLGLLVLGFALSASYATLRPGRRNPAGARQTAMVWSLLLLVALGLAWRAIIVSDRWSDPVGTQITSQEALDAFLAAHPESTKRYDYQIPTGAFLQSFEFLNSHNVEMTGYVWQYYRNDIPESVTRGVVFPEAIEEAYQATEAWRIPRNGGVEIGWYFNGTFRQNFDYQLYPFDRQSIWLRLWHPDPQRNVLLVPDFEAYSDLDPRSLPGIENDFVYGGWDPVRSEFSYKLVSYNMDFGLGGSLDQTPLLNLYFNLSVKRDFLGPLLEHVILELAIAVLLFFLLLLIAKDRDEQDQLGLNLFDLIVAAGGLLFAVILDLNAIRNSIESQQLTYLEWIPLIIICFIVLVVLTAILRAHDWKLPFLGYRGNLVPVLAYWPAMLGSFLVVTLLIFFT